MTQILLYSNYCNYMYIQSVIRGVQDKDQDPGKPIIGSPFSFYIVDIGQVHIRNLQDKVKVNIVVKFDGKLIMH